MLSILELFILLSVFGKREIYFPEQNKLINYTRTDFFFFFARGSFNIGDAVSLFCRERL